MNDDSPTTMQEFQMIRDLRAALGLSDGPLPLTPREAWSEAIEVAYRLRRRSGEMTEALERMVATFRKPTEG